MDFRFSPTEESFRGEVRDWLRENLPAGWGTTVQEPEDEAERFAFRLAWEHRLHAAGWKRRAFHMFQSAVRFDPEGRDAVAAGIDGKEEPAIWTGNQLLIRIIRPETLVIIVESRASRGEATQRSEGA